MSNNYLNSDKHKKEHSHWDRRGFLKVLGIAGAGSISLANSHLSVINSSFVSNALSNSISPYVEILAKTSNPNDLVSKQHPLNSGVNVYNGEVFLNSLQ